VIVIPSVENVDLKMHPSAEFGARKLEEPFCGALFAEIDEVILTG